MELKITTLIENNPDHHGELLYEHGLSLYIEADGRKLLFDTGQSGNFVKNAGDLNKNLHNLDYVFISHGHYDHGGGVEKLVKEVREKTPFVIGEEFFRPKYKAIDGGEYQYNGIPFHEEFLINNQLPIRKIKDELVHITEHIMVFHHYKKHTDYEKRNSKFFIKENGEFVPDNFDDEISLGLITKKGLVVIVGCSHVGIINILKTISEKVDIPIYAVIGGTHLVEADEARIQKTIQAFKDMNIQLAAVSHCTGEEGIRLMRQELKEKFIYNHTGNVIKI